MLMAQHDVFCSEEEEEVVVLKNVDMLRVASPRFDLIDGGSCCLLVQK